MGIKKVVKKVVKKVTKGPVSFRDEAIQKREAKQAAERLQFDKLRLAQHRSDAKLPGAKGQAARAKLPSGDKGKLQQEGVKERALDAKTVYEPDDETKAYYKALKIEKATKLRLKQRKALGTLTPADKKLIAKWEAEERAAKEAATRTEEGIERWKNIKGEHFADPKTQQDIRNARALGAHKAASRGKRFKDTQSVTRYQKPETQQVRPKGRGSRGGFHK